MRLAFLGPVGTFTELAARSWASTPAASSLQLSHQPLELVPFQSVLAELDAVRSGEVDAAVIAYENSVEGSVTISLDGLSAKDPLVIVGEVVIPVSFALLARPGTTMAMISTVAAHSHAEPQCRRWLMQNLPQSSFEPAASNADAARLVQEGRWDAALAGAFAAERYGLEILADGIHDVDGARTRFVVVTRPMSPPPPTGDDKTTVVIFPRDDHPGGLAEILAEFSTRGINLARLESRPIGDGLGQYCFHIDAEGHVASDEMGQTLLALRQMCADVRFLGSYPRGHAPNEGGRGGDQQINTSDPQQWLAEIRRGGHS